MGKLTKNQKAVIAKYDAAKEYKLAEACELVKEITYTKFDASVELHVNLGVDPRTSMVSRRSRILISISFAFSIFMAVSLFWS